MIRKFLSLQWKEFFRSSSFEKGFAIKVLLFIAAIYFGVLAIGTGVGLFFLLKEKAPPGVDPMLIVNSFIIFWFLLELIIRFFMQQTPVMNIKPFMTIPVKKNSIIHFLLGKTMVSFFNIIPLLIFIPYAIVLLVQGYPALNVICWLIGVMSLTFTMNFLNILINKNNAFFYGILGTLVTLIALEYFNIYKVSPFFGKIFNGLYEQPIFVLIPLGLVAFTYYLNFKYFKKNFYIDGVVSKKVKEVSASDLSWMDRFGSLATFLKNDVRLIWRNARPRQVMLMAFLFLFYGLIFYTQKAYMEMPAMLAFASMFITAGFLFSFGQLVPSWDSEYYKMMMSQNISYRKYLESKWYLMVLAVFISFILSTPYLYFGWKIYGMIAAGAAFNLGINSFVTLFGGALNRVPIQLNTKAKAFDNTQGFNPTQLLIALPKMVLPILLFYLPYYFLDSFEAGLICLAGSGLIGLLFKNFFLNQIEKVYQKGKYKTIAAFSEKK